MLTIGCHLSDKDGYLGMAKAAVSIGANTFQFFTRNPRGGAQRSSTRRISPRSRTMRPNTASRSSWDMRPTRRTRPAPTSASTISR
ncbi:MAG: hypothetical protein V8S24_14720 [Gordonibacter pamelaeae]